MGSVLVALDLSMRDETTQQIISKRDEITQQIIAAFPWCFSNVETRARIALSGICAKAIQNAKDNGYKGNDLEMAGLYPQTWDALDDLKIPYQTFLTGEKSECGGDFPKLPSTVQKDAKQGEIVEIEKVRYIVAENNQNQGVGEMTLVREEYIDPTC